MQGMTVDEVWGVVVKHQAKIVRELARKYQDIAGEVNGLYLDEAAKLIKRGVEGLDAVKLADRLWVRSKQACLDYLRGWDNSPKHQEPLMVEWTEWGATEDSACAEVEHSPSAAQIKAEFEIGWQICEAREERLNRVLMLFRIPLDLAKVYALRHDAGYTLEEIGEYLGISRRTAKRRLNAARAALEQIKRDEAEGNLKPREPYTERNKAARGEIERKCGAYRPKAVKPTITKKIKPPETPFTRSMAHLYSRPGTLRLEPIDRVPLKSTDKWFEKLTGGLVQVQSWVTTWQLGGRKIDAKEAEAARAKGKTVTETKKLTTYWTEHPTTHVWAGNVRVIRGAYRRPLRIEREVDGEIEVLAELDSNGDWMCFECVKGVDLERTESERDEADRAVEQAELQLAAMAPKTRWPELRLAA